MSYMNYYKHYNLLNIDISYPEEISTESFSFSKTVEVIKKFLIKVKEFIQNFFKKVINGFKAIFNFLFKRKDKDKKILDKLINYDRCFSG